MNVLIVGGTSGIGEELALQYHNEGHNVGICGRDISKSKLDIPSKFILDVKDKSQVIEVVKTFADSKVDLCIYCAGVYYDSEKGTPSLLEVRELMQTNVQGLINTFDSCLEYMKEGSLVAIASVAAKHHTSMYADSKAAVLNIAESYRKGLKHHKITVHTMLPGYVDTQRLRDLNHGDLSRKPFVVDVKRAAQEIKSAVVLGKAQHMFPKRMIVATIFLRLFPAKLRTFLKKTF